MTPQIGLVLGIVVVSLILFASERFSSDVIALGIVVTLVLAGVLTTKDAFAGFGSDAVLMILGLLIITASLMRTGVVELVGQMIFRVTGKEPKRILAVLLASAGALGSFMSHVAATAFFLPIAIGLAHRARVSSSRYLMPLAFAATLASSVTLVATSTNIVVSGVITQYGLAPLGMFEMTPIGLPILIIGLLYMYFIGSRLIPDRAPVEETKTDLAQRVYLTEMIIQSNSVFVGKQLGSTVLSSELQIQILRIARGLHQHIIPHADVTLEAGDVLLVECARSEIIKIRSLRGVDFRDDEQFIEEVIEEIGEVAIVEVILLPGSLFIGRTLRGLRPRQRFGLQVLAINRHGEPIRQELNTIRMRLGDVLLIQGNRSNIDVLEQQATFRILDRVVEEDRPDLRRAPRAILIFVGVLVISALNIVPLPVAAIAGAVLAFATRCITPEEAYRLVEWKVLILVGGMLALGKAMEATGTAAFLAQQVISLIGTASPLLLLAMFFGLTVALTPLSNSAAAIVMLPVAIRTAQQLGLDPRTFVMTIAVAATNGFLTPLDHVSVMVYGPGRYRFTDFVKVGGVITVLIFVITLLLVPLLWPLK
jgi:di/tricarboxylate transporter